MPCYQPLWAIPTNNKSYRILPRFYVYEHHYSEVNKKITPFVDEYTGQLIQPITIPCGKCIGCRLDYSRQWANRCVLESKCYDEEESTFLTLTYDDYHLTYDDESGEPSLKPKDLQDFIKRFREKVGRLYDKEIRFYACGEYGDEDNRPHFHVLLFGFAFPDLKYKGTSKSGEALYTSKFLDEVWQRKGYCWIGECTWKTCAYTARYVMKKQKGKGSADFYKERGISPEFVRMSLKPGIGKPYFDKYKDKIYRNDEIIIPNGGMVITSKPPPYFDRLLERENPKLMASIKAMRSQVQEDFNSIEVELAQTDLDAAGYFELKEREKIRASKQLKRNLKGVSEI